MSEYPRVAVVICSVGRPECLSFSLRKWIDQSVPPHRIVFSVATEADLPVLSEDDKRHVEILFGPKGLPRQRNRALDLVQDDCEIVAFFDDDYVPSVNALLGLIRSFESLSHANGVTGVLLADGIHGAGLTMEAAADMVSAWEAEDGAAIATAEPVDMGELEGLYGCNMAYRSAAIQDLRFDEQLPLYAWQEDIDFAARLPGKKIKINTLVGVHCGVKAGREKRGDMLGYSQIANPVYLWRKGSMSTRFALRLSLRNFLANHIRVFTPEPWVDRRGRMRGNWIAIADLLRGRLHPERILAL